MSFARGLKRRGRAIVAPLIFLSLVAYFVMNATRGEHGLRARATREQDLRAAQAELAHAQAELASWERRVGALRNNRLDADALDERSRAMLNLSDPADIIVPLKSGERLF